MDTQALLIIMAVFTGVAAVALLIQAGLLLGIYRSSRAMQAKVERLAPKIEAVSESSLATLHESRAKIAEITTKANQILDTTQRQLVKVEGLLDDAALRARKQMDRAELVLEDVMTRAQSAIQAVHSGILKPIREISGVASGLRAAVQFLLRGNRPNPDEVTADEEMFI